MDKNYGVIILISNNFILKRPRVADFAGIIKIAATFIKITLKDSKVKMIRNCAFKCNLYMYFFI